MATYTDVPISLEPGDHLTREEFHRRYCARPDIKKAELIEGVVYVPSPVRADLHGNPHTAVAGWLYAYKARNPAVHVPSDTTVFLDADGIIGRSTGSSCAMASTSRERRAPTGSSRSSRFPGLRLYVPSMLAGDAAGVLAALGPIGLGL